jgi:hypothetical protein
VVYAAGQLGGERGVELAQALAQRVEAIITAQADFAAHAGLQEQLAVVWRYATYAAAQLGGERALELSQALAQRVEAIVTAQADFAAHAGLQEQRAEAWRYAAAAACVLGGENGKRAALAAGRRVRNIALIGHFADFSGIQDEWQIVQRILALLGIGLTNQSCVELTWNPSREEGGKNET